jgi:hypothetical protein
MNYRNLFLVLLSMLMFGCQKEFDPDPSQPPRLAGTEMTYDYSTHGFDMHVFVPATGPIQIATAVSSRPAQDGDDFLVFGPGAEEAVVGPETFEAPSSTGESMIYTQVNLPPGHGKYWAIPFDPTMQPVEMDLEGDHYGIKIGLSPCLCSGEVNAACFSQWTGCASYICAACGRHMIIVVILSGAAVQPPVMKPFAIIEGDQIVMNGVDYN